MVETIIALLIQICVLVVVVYLVFWVLSVLGVGIPPKIVQIIWLIVALFVLLWLFRALPGLGVHLRL